MDRLLSQRRGVSIRTTRSPDDGVGEPALRIAGLVASVFGDAHLPTDLESPLGERRRIDDRTGSPFHLWIDERRPLWWQSDQLSLGFVKTSVDVMNEVRRLGNLDLLLLIAFEHSVMLNSFPR